MTLKVTDYDMRGDDEVFFGFVYFNDDRRVAYAFGEVQGDTTGGWPAVSTQHVRVAEKYLREKGLIK